jgi:hypothetical protein
MTAKFMSRRAIVLLVASVIVGLACTAAVSTDADAKKAVRHRDQVAIVAVPAAPVPAAVIDNHDGRVAAGIPRCFDSVIYYPYPPCY